MKGLEALKRIAERMANKEPMIVRDYTNIEEELKALEIIIEKEVNISMLKSYLKCGVGLKDFTYQEYKKYNYAIFSKIKLTEEEYELLKEVLYGKETS